MAASSAGNTMYAQHKSRGYARVRSRKTPNSTEPAAKMTALPSSAAMVGSCLRWSRTGAAEVKQRRVDGERGAAEQAEADQVDRVCDRAEHARDVGVPLVVDGDEQRYRKCRGQRDDEGRACGLAGEDADDPATARNRPASKPLAALNLGGLGSLLHASRDQPP